MRRRVLPPKHPCHTLQTAAAVFLDRPDLSPASRRSNAQTLQRLTHAIGDDRSLETLDGADVETAVQSAWGHRAPATWNRHVATVRSFIAFCHSTQSGSRPAMSESHGRQNANCEEAVSVANDRTGDYRLLALHGTDAAVAVGEAHIGVAGRL
jgi:hypothetical protein